ncbi:MAG: hypothetical protein ACTSYQ_03140, partial [Candidatus Odinarchaeia archaeon]
FTSSHVNDMYEDVMFKEADYQLKLQMLKKTEYIGEEKKIDIESYRLKLFIEQLTTYDQKFKEKIIAKENLPSFSNVVKKMIIYSAVRIFFLILLSFIILNPVPVLTFLGAPTALLESVEILTPEIVILLLLPIALLFPFSSLIISYLKKEEKNSNHVK